MHSSTAEIQRHRDRLRTFELRHGLHVICLKPAQSIRLRATFPAFALDTVSCNAIRQATNLQIGNNG